MNIVIGPSRWRHAILLLGSLAFVAGGIFLLLLPPSRSMMATPQHLVGWSSIVFFGGCALVGVWQLIDSRPRLVIDDESIFDRTLGVGLIPWPDIQDAYLRSISRHEFICLQIANPERYLRRTNAMKQALANANAKLGFTPISLNLVGTAANPSDLLELILKRIHEPPKKG